MPCLITGLQYVKRTMGQDSCGTTSFNIEIILLKFVPLAKERAAESRMTGPSSNGSEWGRPSSIMSDPHESSTFKAAAVVERSGSPAVM